MVQADAAAERAAHESMLEALLGVEAVKREEDSTKPADPGEDVRNER
jgi:hypothetical protein